MRPNSYPEEEQEAKKTNVKKEIHQSWHLNGRCPKGTVPILRTQKGDLMRAVSLKNFNKKYPSEVLHPQAEAVKRTGREFATAYTDDNKYWGTKAEISIWNPRVQPDLDYSLAQIWVVSKNFQSQTSLEVGWTADGSHSTGCYNLKCSGFVQVNSDIALGATATPISVYDGPQYQMTVSIFKEQDTGNWWLQVQGNPLGYWPSSLVPGIANGAERLQYGGEIFDKGQTLGDGGQHTTTEMGSGHFPDEGEKKASVFTNIQVVDLAQYAYISPKQVKPFVMRPGCYDVSVKRSDNWGLYFFYGGPGRNPKCP
ncbi:hypothetical protein QJS04_geneDACA010448 [Acorus gramineus]|uniref:Neprosin PEP catalytic domain-containing protein n=1 Tax=Acorus gramineus TaxID=55184 RepID=A0AAV9AK34_ACOGR|nr:hypothetical protein QJS04_geneDACA010448 [Acorus gramineus]